jgi:hypothetical protein
MCSTAVSLKKKYTLSPMSNDKADRHDITEILLKVALNTTNHHQPFMVLVIMREIMK